MRRIVQAAWAREPGPDAERLPVLGCVVAPHNIGVLGTRAHHGHLAAEHVHELRQLVDFQPAQRAAERKHPRVALGGDDAPRAVVHVHRAQLVHREQASVPSDQAGAIEDRAGTRQADPHRGQRQDRGGGHEAERRDDDVKQAFRHRAGSAVPS